MLRILGIDPGVGRVGWGVVEKNSAMLTAHAWGRIETASHENLPSRLATIATTLQKLIKRYAPNVVAVEELFFAKNVKTAVAVAHMRGVILSIAALKRIPVAEFTPLEVKQTLTGYGRAEKRQVQAMLKAIFNIQISASHDDAADALAVAYTALVSSNIERTTHNKSSSFPLLKRGI